MKLAILLALGLALPLVHAGVIDDALQQERQEANPSPQQAWIAWGGDIGVRWNRSLLKNLGVKVEARASERIDKSDRRRHEWFALREIGGLRFLVGNGSLQRFSGGMLRMQGGYVLRLRDNTVIDLRDLHLHVRDGAPEVLDVVDGDGKAWFFVDHLMYELADARRTLAIRAADLRITPELAARIGRPEAVGWAVADLAMNAQIYVQGSDEVAGGSCSPYPWPGTAVPGGDGARYEADLFMQYVDFQPADCQDCDGPGGALDGIVSFVPSSTLRNNVNDGVAQATVPGDPLGTSTVLHAGNVAWHMMFTGVAPGYNPPYGNDQHPFLIWNLYRINAGGGIEQIGRSGVKHAFLTINSGCLGSCYDEHSLGRGCSDTYGTFNNDSPSDMGPRSEIVPATGVWGRCGSIWDPDCTGDDQGNGNDDWTQRLKVRESQVDPAANAGASYLMDSWYVARDDVDIYNSMATVTGTPHYASGLWTFANQGNYRLGAAIDRWVDPASPGANAMNTELAVADGHAKVAVKATELGDGIWRYDYAVMNFDFARAVVQEPANGPDPRVVSNHGFDRFSVPLSSSQKVVATGFSNGTQPVSDVWSVDTGGDRVTWTAPPGATLDWGTLYSFSLTVAAAPAAGTSALHVAQEGDPAAYEVATLVPASANDVIFKNGFDAIAQTP